MDLDFTLAKEVPFDTIRNELEAVFAEFARASGGTMRFARHDRHSHLNTHTFFLSYEGPLPTTRAAKEIKVDITIRERLGFPLEQRRVLRGYKEYADLPEDATVQIYSLDEIAAEKIVALMDRARTEPRDLYDVWYLFGNKHVDTHDLLKAVERKLDFRKLTLAEVRDNLAAKEARYERLWEKRLAAQMAELPDFAGVYRLVRRVLRQSGLIGN